MGKRMMGRIGEGGIGHVSRREHRGTEFLNKFPERGNLFKLPSRLRGIQAHDWKMLQDTLLNY